MAETSPYSTINHQEFTASITCTIPSTHHAPIEAAYQFAKYAHRNQKRACGRRYFDHPRELAIILMTELKVTDWRCIVLALIHDIEEDSFLFTDWATEQLFGSEIACWLHCLSKKPKQGYWERLLRFGSPIVWLVKLVDRLHNLRSLYALPLERQERQIEETTLLFLPLTDQLQASLPADERWRAVYLKTELTRCIADWRASHV